jgi:hypothetical protein
MTKYTIRQTRTFVTTIVVEADNLIEAEDRYFELVASGYAHDLEMQQNYIEDQCFDIKETK